MAYFLDSNLELVAVRREIHPAELTLANDAKEVISTAQLERRKLSSPHRIITLSH